MARTKLHTLADVGQSVWLDYTRRSFVTGGGLQAYINKGLRGITSNPSIFEKAIAETNEYDEDIQKLGLPGKSAEEIHEVTQGLLDEGLDMSAKSYVPLIKIITEKK